MTDDNIETISVLAVVCGVILVALIATAIGLVFYRTDFSQLSQFEKLVVLILLLIAVRK